MFKALCDRILSEIDNNPNDSEKQIRQRVGGLIAAQCKLTAAYGVWVDMPLKRGMIDMVFYRGSEAVLALELDDCYKRGSLEKLQHFTSKHKLWVCYSPYNKPEKLERLSKYGVPICTRFVRLNGVD